MSGEPKPLWLDPVSPVLRERAKRALEAGDVSGFLCTAGNEYGFYLVAHNQRRLRQAGLYEAALLKAYAATGTNNAHHMEAFLKSLFQCGDKQKFREAGDPLPDAGPYTLYRGVAGEGEKRRERGLSWTSDLELAWWYAYWYHLQKRQFQPLNPAVVSVTVPETDVIAYVNDSGRNEQEFLVLVPQAAKVEAVPADGGLEAARNCDNRKQDQVMKDFDRVSQELA